MIVIEGIIGAGKTTLGEMLSKKFRLPFFTELSSYITSKILGKFYKDKERWAFLSQMNFLNERFTLVKKIFRKKGGILDRSFYGDSIFAEVLYDDKCIGELEYQVYKSLLLNMKEHIQNPTLVIYLDISVDKAIERIRSRDRDFETGIERSYLEKLNEKYAIWYENYTVSPKVKLDYDNFNIFDEDDKSRVISLIKDNLK